MEFVNENNVALKKRMTTEATVFNEWFLSILLEYLNMKEIVILDSAICNKPDRNKWLECIAKDMGSVATKIQPYLRDDGPIIWCSKRNVQFKCLAIDNIKKPYSVTTVGASLLSMCSKNMIEFHLYYNIRSPEILIELGQQCSKLKKLKITSEYITDKDLALLLSHNIDLEHIELGFCERLGDDSLMVIAAHCRRLRTILFDHMTHFTDKGMEALVSVNHDLEDIGVYSCTTLLTYSSLMAIANSCHKLKVLDISNAEWITDEGFVALVSNNLDLEEIGLEYRPLLTDVSIIALTSHCHRLRKVYFSEMDGFTDQGIATLVSANHDLEEIRFDSCAFLNNFSLKAIANNCHKLTRLDISNAELITDEGFVALVSSNPNLEEIDLSDCPLLTDASVIAIADNCSKLKTLELSYLEMSSSSLEYVRQKCPGIKLEWE